MIGGSGVSMPQIEQTPAAPTKEDPEIEEARRRKLYEERRKGVGSTVLTGATGVNTTAPTQQARLLAR